MAKARSFVARLTIDTAQRAHNCQHNAGHRIRQGDRRLKITEDRSSEHYCIPCAIRFLEADITKLNGLLAVLNSNAGTDVMPEGQ